MRKQINTSVRHKIVALREAKSHGAIALQLHLWNPPEVCTIYNSFLKTGSVKAKVKPGRPKKISNRDKRFITREERKLHSRQLNNFEQEFNSFSPSKTLSESTIRVMLHKNNIHGTAAQRSFLNART